MSDDLPYHRIARQFYNRPLLLLPSAAETISAFLLSRIGAGPGGGRGENDAAKSVQVFAPTQSSDGAIEYHSPRASRFYGNTPLDENGRPLPFRRMEDGTAIITIVGELVNRGAWVGASSGLISYEGIKFQLARAAADPKTRAIVLDLESPGGEAVGAFEVAAAVREAAKQKEVVAVVNGMAASAGYAIASGASRIVTIPSGLAGSIGVVMVHLDFSKWLEEEGIKPTLIFSGAHKVDGNPFEPLPDEVRDRFQAESASFYAQFVEAVAAGRSGLTEAAVRATEADIFKGQDAVDAGLADSVGSFEEVLADLSRGSQGRSLQSTQLKGSSMDTNTGASAANAGNQITTAAQLATAYPTLAAELRAEGATAERTRILGIEKLALPGHDQLVAAMKADPTVSADAAAGRILEAEKQSRAKQLQGIKDVEQTTGAIAAAPNAQPPAPAAESQAATPDGWKAEYAKSKELQAEFASAESYVAYQQGVADGRIRILKAKSA